MSGLQTPVTPSGPTGTGPIGRGPVGVAVIGAGNISKAYLDNLTVFPDLKVLVIADLFEEAAQARAKEYGSRPWRKLMMATWVDLSGRVAQQPLSSDRRLHRRGGRPMATHDDYRDTAVTITDGTEMRI